MNNLYRVAVHFNEDLGYVEYDSDTKTAKVALASPEIKTAVDNYLSTMLEIMVPHETLNDFTTETIEPLGSLANFKLAMTRLWGNTGVYVDWSRPI